MQYNEKTLIEFLNNKYANNETMKLFYKTIERMFAMIFKELDKQQCKINKNECVICTPHPGNLTIETATNDNLCNRTVIFDEVYKIKWTRAGYDIGNMLCRRLGDKYENNRFYIDIYLSDGIKNRYFTKNGERKNETKQRKRKASKKGK